MMSKPKKKKNHTKIDLREDDKGRKIKLEIKRPSEAWKSTADG